MEGVKESAAVDFLSKQIQGSRWHGTVYLAGGFPRDQLLGLDPKDIDLVIDFPDGGIEFAKWITAKLKLGAPVIFPRFGTAKFTLKNITHMGQDLSGIDIECVMPRTEKYTQGSRKPQVALGTMKDDVERRDFTVNSLLKNLTSGEILDLTGKGKEDIKRGIVRSAIDPNIIFREDPLRMLRAIRFTVKYGWTLPLFMIKALKANASLLKQISSERIQDELNKILVTASPDTGIRLLQMTGLNQYVIPELDLLVGLKQNRYHVWDANKHTLEVVKAVPAELVRRLTALLHDIGKAQTQSVIAGELHFYRHEEIGAEMAEDILRRLKYPTDIISAVVAGVGNHMRLKGAGLEGEIVSDKALRKLKNDLGPHIEHILDVMHADNLSHAVPMDKQIPKVRDRLSKLGMPEGKIVLPIDGNDVISILKIEPGPKVGKLLAKVKDAWLANPHLTRDEAIAIIKKAKV